MEEFKKNIGKFLPFLEELQRRLFTGVILFAVCFVTGFMSAGIILKKLTGLIDYNKEVTLVVSSPFQFIQVAMDLGFFLAILITAPYVVYNFYSFILPALTKSERKILLKLAPVTLGLFICGFFYGLLVLYYALGMLASLNTSLGIANFWNISQFLSEMLVTSVMLGLFFEFPIVLTLLIKFGVITSTTLKDNRRVAYAVLLILAVVLPPTDPVSLLALVAPLWLLYEATIVLNTKKYGIRTGL